MLGQPKESFCAWWQSVFAPYHQKSVGNKGLVKSSGNLVLKGVSEIGVNEVATKNQVIIIRWLFPDQVVFNPLNPLREVLG